LLTLFNYYRYLTTVNITIQMSTQENRRMTTIYSQNEGLIESLGVEIDRSFAYTTNLLVKEALTKRGLIKQEESDR